jgi:CRP-like cAMP-binding protein
VEPNSFLALLRPDDREALEAAGRERKFPRGAVLMYAGEPGERVMVLLAGRVKITRVAGDGQEMVLNIRGPGEILGELAFIDEELRLADVTALEPVIALVLASTEFHRYLESNPRAAVVILTILSRRYRDAAIKRAELMSLDTLGRLAARLAELADRYGEPAEGGVLITVPLSQQELGAFIGASHAGLAKALQTLRELGWITTERRRIVVRDLEALRSRAE